MITVYIKEEKKYTQSDLLKLFNTSENIIKRIIKLFRKFGIIKVYNKSKKNKPISFDDISELNNQSNVFYKFDYVGVIHIENYILKCYPKYISNTNNIDNDLKQILKVIKKYDSREQKIYLFDEFENKKTFNELSLSISFIEDYFKNGLYKNTLNITNINDDGEILWNKTINNNDPFIFKNKPYYMELYTKKRILDNENYFKRLHETIITKSSIELEKAGILDLLDLARVELNNENLESFGDYEDILYKIEQEMNIQYNTQKLKVLKMMYSYISCLKFNLNNDLSFSFYGTTSYNLIWEKMCSCIVQDKKNELLGDLLLPSLLNPKYKENQKLLSIISKPQWFINNKNKKSDFTLKPDSIAFYKHDEELEFIIFDAKYYDIHIENNIIEEYPDIGSITKQYLYEKAYSEFIKLEGFTNIRNCFLFPTEKNEIIRIGHVELEFLKSSGLRDIELIMIPAKKINQLYLENEILDLSSLLK